MIVTRKTYKLTRPSGTTKILEKIMCKPDGTLWINSISPLIDTQSEEFLKIGAAAMDDLARKGKAPKGTIIKVGKNPSGLEVVEVLPPPPPVRTPAQIERDAIFNLFEEANKRENASDDCNTMDAYRLRGEAKTRLEAWRIKYPAEDVAEKAEKLLAAADKQESLAKQALYYDCDGSFTPEYQQQRHDEFMSEAIKLRAEAKALTS